MSEELPDLVGQIYDASYEKENWAGVLKGITEITRSSSAALIYRDIAYPKANFVYSSGIPIEVLKMYLDQYIHIDPFVDLIVKALPLGEVSADHHVIPDRQRLRSIASEFHDDFMIPNDLYHIGGAGILVDEQRMAAIAIQRKQELGPWSDEDLAQLRKLTPHLQRAFRIYREFTRLSTHEYMIYAMLDQLVIGLILLDREGKIVYHNPAAKRLLKTHSAISQRHGRMVVTDKDSAEKMHDLISHVSGTHEGGRQRSGIMALKHVDSNFPLLALISPAADLQKSYQLLGNSACVAVFLSDSQNQLPISPDALMETYGLTHAESEVAVALTNGMSLKDISDARGSSIETVRSQLKAVFSKTNTKCQADLVRLLLTGVFTMVR